MVKEIITHYDCGAHIAACGVWCYGNTPLTTDRDKVTCIRCQRTHSFRGVVPQWYATKEEKFRHMTNAQLVAELNQYLRYYWSTTDRATSGILLNEIRERMVERDA